jgi:hypothetical protein
VLNPFPMIEARVTRTVPDVLYHYTSSQGLSGIIRHKALWAKDIHHLDDPRELLHALDMASAAIQAYKPESLNTLQVNAGVMMLEYLRGMKEGKLFVASLTEAGDLLSQWRAYCPSEGGFSIGFSTGAFSESPDWTFFKLYPCLYRLEEQQDLMQFIVGSYLGILQGIPTPHSQAMKGLWESVAFWFVGAVMRVAPLLKHSSFFEEREWRLVTMSPASRRPLPPPPIGANPNSYTQFRLAPDGVRDVIREVWVGPTAQPRASVAAVRRFLDDEGLAGTDVYLSACPVRRGGGTVRPKGLV